MNSECPENREKAIPDSGKQSRIEACENKGGYIPLNPWPDNASLNDLFKERTSPASHPKAGIGGLSNGGAIARDVTTP
jgi:hypothetical protein